MVVASPLLEAKLFVPNPRSSLVERPRLMEKLQHGSRAKLTLVSAPAGSGKTTLLADWAASEKAPKAAWLSLDDDDNQSAVFWAYVAATLQTVAPVVGSSPPVPGGAGLTALLNEMSAIPDDVVLILDDYHVIEAAEIHDEVAFLIDHLPDRVHLVMATRSDPVLPLSRLRASGELVEVRAADLNFTLAESDAYLNHLMRLGLAPEDVAVLDERTEGWIAALQLAALSLQGREDPTAFISGFAGSDRYIVDYLMEEVLDRQSEEMRAFLLQTSILRRLTGPLCDAVTGQDHGKAMLEALDRANLFIVPLDDHRIWYRYHHLFADVLQARLLDESPGLLFELHRRASDWLERAGQRLEAVRHAFAAEDYARAADLVELALPELRRRRQERMMREWLDAIPEEFYDSRPVLAVGFVSSRLVSGELEGVETRLEQAERWLNEHEESTNDPSNGSDAMVVRDEASFRRLPGSIALYRTGIARARGDLEETIAQALRTLELTDEDDHLERGGAAGFLALAHWSLGELEESFRWWSAAADDLEAGGHLSDVLGCRIALADILLEQGRLADAIGTYESGLKLGDDSDVVLRGVADMHVGVAGALCEGGNLVTARTHLQLAEELGELAGMPQNAHRSKVVAARIAAAEGDLDAAVDLLDEAERLYISDYFPDIQPIAARRARVWVRQGRVGQALAWARDRGLVEGDEPSYLREFEHLTLARALLADAGGDTRRLRRIDNWLGRIMIEVEQGRRSGNLMEAMLLRSIAWMGVDRDAAQGWLAKAVALADPEGQVEVFTEHRAAIIPLLETMAAASDPARALLGALAPSAARPPLQRGLIDPLTERELEVLRLLSTDLSGPEIARELYVSLNTLRTHTKSIFSKLGVKSRRAAVTRAAELDLLPATPR